MELLAVLGLIALIPVSAMLNGYVLSVLWGWFMVPTFDLPSLSVAPAIGIALVIGYLTRTYDPRKINEHERKEVGAALIEAFISPFLSLFIGWIVHLFM